MAKKGAKATIFDFPETIKIAKKVARHEGMKGIRFIAGAFHVDSLGSRFDLILVSRIFHASSAEKILVFCESAGRSST